MKKEKLDERVMSKGLKLSSKTAQTLENWKDFRRATLKTPTHLLNIAWWGVARPTTIAL